MAQRKSAKTKCISGQIYSYVANCTAILFPIQIKGFYNPINCMPIKIIWFLLFSHRFLLIFSADFPLYFFVKHFQCKVNKAGANSSLVFGFAHFLQRSMTLTLIGPCLISPPSIHQHITIMLGSIRQNTKGLNSFWSMQQFYYLHVCLYFNEICIN